MEQLDSRLGAVGVGLSSDILDRIDEMVPPGTTFSPARPSARHDLQRGRRRLPSPALQDPLGGGAAGLPRLTGLRRSGDGRSSNWAG
jgi:hypothetical protein